MQEVENVLGYLIHRGSIVVRVYLTCYPISIKEVDSFSRGLIDCDSTEVEYIQLIAQTSLKKLRIL